MIATDSFTIFGTSAVLAVTEAAALGPARAIADAELTAIDLACSRFRPDSEISRLIIRSEAAPAWLADCGLPARLVRRNGTLQTTPGWPRYAAMTASILCQTGLNGHFTDISDRMGTRLRELQTTAMPHRASSLGLDAA
ncbi:MAG: hypothetical protein ACTHJW_09495 [Streptosporangiaceae bacterium]